MIIFEKITLQNFLSYGNDSATLDLQRKNPTLITGINHDASVNGEMDSNGCGKSSLLMAITFALYDVALGKEAEKKDNLINNINKKDLLVILEFKVKNDQYKISRYRKNKTLGGTGVKIEKNGKDITPDSISNANSFIADEIVKVPYEIFSRIITYAANEESFLKLPLSKQRDVIEELFSYTELTKKAEILKEKIKTSKIELKYAIDSNEEIKTEHAQHRRRVEEAEANIISWEESRASEIENVQTIINKYNNFNFEKEEKMLEEADTHERNIEKLQSLLGDEKRSLDLYQREQTKFEEYDGLKADKIQKIKNELQHYERFSDVDLENQIAIMKDQSELLQVIREKEEELKRIESDQDKAIKTIEELEEEQKVRENSTCPECLQKYVGEEAENKLEEVKQQISSISKALKKSLKNSESISKEIHELREKVQDISKLLSFDNPVMVERYQSERNVKQNRLEELINEKNPYSDQSSKIIRASDNIIDLTHQLEKAKATVIKTNFGSLRELYDIKQKFSSAVDKLTFLKEQENPYEKSLEILKGFVIKESKSEEIDNLEKLIRHQEFLLKLLTKKDSFIRKALMDKYLPFLNERLRHYLSTMGLPHKAQFNSDLSMQISQFDREITFTSLSSGQKARINIALSLAFRDVLQSKHNFINLYILDECLDVGLSNVGVRKTVKLIKEVADKNKLSMFVISHRDEVKESFKDQIEIELKNGFSKIKGPE